MFSDYFLLLSFCQWLQRTKCRRYKYNGNLIFLPHFFGAACNSGFFSQNGPYRSFGRYGGHKAGRKWARLTNTTTRRKRSGRYVQKRGEMGLKCGTDYHFLSQTRPRKWVYLWTALCPFSRPDLTTMMEINVSGKRQAVVSLIIALPMLP